MVTSKTDNNGVATAFGVLNTDGETVTLLRANPTSHALDVSDGSSGSDIGRDTSKHDDDMRTSMCATDASGNIIPLWLNSSNQLLIKST